MLLDIYIDRAVLRLPSFCSITMYAPLRFVTIKDKIIKQVVLEERDFLLCFEITNWQ